MTINERQDIYLGAPKAFKCIFWAVDGHLFKSGGSLIWAGPEEGTAVAEVVDGPVDSDGGTGVFCSRTRTIDKVSNNSPQYRMVLRAICLGVCESIEIVLYLIQKQIHLNNKFRADKYMSYFSFMMTFQVMDFKQWILWETSIHVFSYLVAVRWQRGFSTRAFIIYAKHERL